jgi:hypothetical protein
MVTRSNSWKACWVRPLATGGALCALPRRVLKLSEFNHRHGGRKDRLIERRSVLRAGATLAAAGPSAASRRQSAAATRQSVVDDDQRCRVHAYAANTPERPWYSVPNWPPHVTGDEMVAAMDKVGVDGAIYISPFSMYQYDASGGMEVQTVHPDKFALVKPVNPDDPAVADVIAERKKTAGAAGIRIIMTKESKRAPDDPGWRSIAPVQRQLCCWQTPTCHRTMLARSTDKATKGWATINALQFLESEPRINILRCPLNLRLLPIAATAQNFQGFRR